MTTLAYPHTLVAGQPENVNDLNDNLNAITTLVNGNLDAGNLATSAKPVTVLGQYKTVADSGLVLTSANTGATTYIGSQGGGLSVATTTSGLLDVFPLDPADHAVTGLTTQFRIHTATITNTVAPAVNFTYSLRQITGLAGGASSITITTVGSALGAVTRAAPAAQASFIDNGSDFTLPGSGVYVLCVSSSGTPAVNSNAQFRVTLQVHHI